MHTKSLNVIKRCDVDKLKDNIINLNFLRQKPADLNCFSKIN